MRCSRHTVALAVLVLVLVSCQQPAAGVVQPALQEFQSRLPVLRTQIATLAASAKQAAAARLAQPAALLSVPSREQVSFCEEMINRAGGLAMISATEPTPQGDLPPKCSTVLLSVRSWEQQRDVMLRRVKAYRDLGWTVVVFASAAGCPPELEADCVIDNGAASPAAALGRINVLANVTLAWMWQCEYCAALSRDGQFPAILYSNIMPGAKEHNAKYQVPEGRRLLLPCAKALPAGELAENYLARVEQLTVECVSARIQQQVTAAAELISQRIGAGKPIAMTGSGHLIKDEIRRDHRTPWNAFLPRGDMKALFDQQVGPGALVVWMTYAGMDTPYRPYAEFFVQSGADLITSYAPAPEHEQNLPKRLAHIEQSWALPDAVVPIPLFPDHMAPLSGISICLLLRMLDDETASRLAEVKEQR